MSAPTFLAMPHSQTLLERIVAPQNVNIVYTVSDMWKGCFCIVPTTFINKRGVKILGMHYKISNTKDFKGRKKYTALGSRQPFEIQHLKH
jgi:hypothetical protein